MKRLTVLLVFVLLLAGCFEESGPVKGFVTRKEYTPAFLIGNIMQPEKYVLQVRVGKTGELVEFEVGRQTYESVKFGDWFDSEERR